MICSMCENNQANVFDKWPAPVCSNCDVWLDGLGKDLSAMEDADPTLRKLAQDITDALPPRRMG